MNTKVRTKVQAMRAASMQDKAMNKEKKTQMQESKTSTEKEKEKEKEREIDGCRSRRERKIALQQDVDKLKKKLRHEENVHRTLQRAFTRPLGALPRLPPYLPSHTLELLAEVAVLEEEVVRLEEQVVDFRQGLYHEAIYFSSSKKTKQSGSELKQCDSLPNSEALVATKPPGSFRWSWESEPNWHSSINCKRTAKNMTSSFTLADDWRGKENQLSSKFTRISEPLTAKKISRAKSFTLDNKRANVQIECAVANKESSETKSSTESALDKSSASNKLSEDILTCLMNIYSRMSCSRTTTEPELEASPSVSSSCLSLEETDLNDPFGTCKEFGRRDVGPYQTFQAIELSSMSQNSLVDSPLLMRRLKFLLRKLAVVDLSQLTHQQKLAFWINIYNSCMMNAFLEQGMPSSPEMLVALMPKATLNVGGHLLNAMAVEHFILRSPFHSKNVSVGGTKSDNIIMRGIYGLEWSEPLVTFALSCGSWSSPAVRVYSAQEVENELETAKTEYLQAAIGILAPDKLAVPKLLDWYLLDFAKDVESLMDWICLQLPSHLRTEAVKCLEMSRSSRIAQPIQILPYEFRFSYVWHSQAEDAGKRIAELELMLQAANYRTEELEKLLSSTEVKLKDTEAESKQHSSKVSELFAELEAYQARSASLEAVLQAEKDKEIELIDNLDAANEVRKKMEDLLSIEGQKNSEAERMIQLLQSNLKSLQVKVERTELELESSNVQEKELFDKLRFSEEEMEHHRKTIEELTTRNLELNTSYASLLNDSELKLQNAAEIYKQKESEAKELQEKFKSLEDESAFYRNQAVEATEEVASLKAELEANAVKLVYLETSIEELNKKVSEADTQVKEKSSENNLLVRTNSQLREDLEAYQYKIDKLDGLLKSTQKEKEAIAEQLVSHTNTIGSLTDKHSRGLELQVAAEYRLKDTEAQLHEVVENFKQRDMEARSLNENLILLENQLKDQSEQLETEKEVLASKNLSLSEELAIYQAKMNQLQAEMTTVISEKEDLYVQLHSYRKEMENLMQQFRFENEKLQSEMETLVEENQKLKEMYQKETKEREEVALQLEEKLNEGRTREVDLVADMENLKAELDQKHLMQKQILELEEKISLVEKAYTEEIESLKSTAVERDSAISFKIKENSSMLQEKDVLDRKIKELQDEVDMLNAAINKQKELESQNELERESSFKQSVVEIENKHQEAILLERQVEELKKKLQQAEVEYEKKVTEASDLEAELENLRPKLNHAAEMEKEIAELKDKLQSANAKSAREVKDEKADDKSQDSFDARSRDIGVGPSTLSKRKSKKRSEEALHLPKTSSVHPAENVEPEPSGAMAFKFMLGVALISMIVGIILGKRY